MVHQKIQSYAFAVAIGLLAMVTQLALIRILSMTFYGNELSICLAIGNWLWWTGIGSYSSRYWVERIKNNTTLVLLGTLNAVVIIGITYLLTLSRFVLGLSPSEIIGILPIWLWSLAVFALPGLLNGLFFPALVQWHYRKRLELPIRNIYIAEAIGSALGGLFFALLIWQRVSTFRSLHWAVLILILSIAFFLITKWWQRLLYLSGCLFLWGLSLWRGAPALLQLKWEPLQVVEFLESPYQAFTLLEYHGSRIVYADSEPLWVVGDRQRAEEIVHFALLNHPAPRRILVIGLFNPDIADEIAQYQSIEEVVYLQPDAQLLAIMERQFGRRSADVAERSIIADPVDYLRRTTESYDIVLLNVPLPVTANYNRYYTVEFYRLLKARLKAGGLIAMSLPGDEEYFTTEQRVFLKSVEHTVAQVFKQRTWIPGSTLHLLAGDAPLHNDYGFIHTQLEQRKLNTRYISIGFLRDRLGPLRLAFLEKQLANPESGMINRLSRPIGFYFDTVLWDQRTGGSFKDFYIRLAGLQPAYLLIVIAILLLAGGGLVVQKPAALAVYTICGIGCVTMSFEAVCLIIYQSLVGSLYFHIVFLTLAYMLGATLGGWWFRPDRKLPPVWKVMRLYVALPIIGGSLLYLPLSAMFIAPLIYLALLGTGFLTGYCFLLLAWQVGQGQANSAGRIGGKCYAADILGAASGVYCSTVLTIPIFGLMTTLLLIGLICLVYWGLTFFAKV